MAVFERETRVDAPLSAVWAFHSTVEGLRRVTPDWLGLRVERVRGPDGADAGSDATLVPGTTLWLAVEPFGVGPRVAWTSQVTAREKGERAACFRDEMRQGPLRRWRHTHSFAADGDATVLRDRVEYATPLGQAADEVVRAGLAAAFRDRHRRTRRALASGECAGQSRA